MDSAPTIRTERLTLRHHQMSDFAPLGELFASERAIYMGGPIDRQKLWYWVAGEVGSWSLQGFGSWGIETHGGAFVGQVGINKPSHFPEIELGYLIMPEFEGKGIAFEAAQAARAWAFDALSLETFVSYIDPKNARSIALAERLGASHDAQATLPDGETPDETAVYRHRRAA
ncbi:GNAT family N-acetyltransferase [Planktotalea sp.]|uniref:GNAT family N-acetyltransferase n=1 Tax=Planktotalea sp. TaxID=2029877 RepID=UPI0035C80EA5